MILADISKHCFIGDIDSDSRTGADIDRQRLFGIIEVMVIFFVVNIREAMTY